jgi:hypothetical protein
MDDDRFDGLAKALARGMPRRRVLQGLASTLAGVLALGGVTAVEAKGPCRAPKTRCGKGKHAICVDLQSDPNNCNGCGQVCPGPTSGSGSTTCSGGNCGIRCSGSSTLCGTDCVDLQTDPKHCGRCGNDCWTCHSCGGECCAGVCGLCFAAGQVCCDGSYCAPLSPTMDTCEICGHPCAPGERCCPGTSTCSVRGVC